MLATPVQSLIVPHYSTWCTVHPLCACTLFNAAKRYESDTATGYMPPSSSTPNDNPCYDNVSLVTAEVLIRTATQRSLSECNSHVLVLQSAKIC